MTLNFADSPAKRIAIEGVIGVGKTSLARMLVDRWKAEACFEIFEDNPFLTNGFYENPQELAFNTEIFFLLTRFRQQRDLKIASKLLVSDYLFEKNAIFAKMNLSDEDFALYASMYDRLQTAVAVPDLV